MFIFVPTSSDLASLGTFPSRGRLEVLYPKASPSQAVNIEKDMKQA